MNTPPPLPKQSQPVVVLLFRIFCLGLAAFLTLGSVISLVSEPQLGVIDSMISAEDETLRQQLLEEERKKNQIMQGMSAIMIPVLLLGAALPARPWSFVYGLVVLGVSCLLCLPIPFVIPLFIFWIRPETNRYFRK